MYCQEPHSVENVCLQFDREWVLSRLEDLKNYYSFKLNGRVDIKKDMLKNLCLELDNFSFPHNAYRGRTLTLSRKVEEVDNHVRTENKIYTLDQILSKSYLKF